MDKYNTSVQHTWFHHATWGSPSLNRSNVVGEVTWHSLTEDGKVELVSIKFGDKLYKNINVNKLKPIQENSHKHSSKKKKKDERVKLTRSRLKEIIQDEIQKLNEAGKMILFQIPETDKRKTKKILDKLRLKTGKDYDFGVGKGSNFILALNKQYQDDVLELLIINKVRVRGG